MSKDFERAIEATRVAMSEEDYTIFLGARAKRWLTLTEEEFDILEYIHDCMEEYGEDHDLPEGWWQDEADLFEVVMNYL